MRRPVTAQSPPRPSSSARDATSWMSCCPGTHAAPSFTLGAQAREPHGRARRDVGKEPPRSVKQPCSRRWWPSGGCICAGRRPQGASEAGPAARLGGGMSCSEPWPCGQMCACVRGAASLTLPLRAVHGPRPPAADSRGPGLRLEVSDPGRAQGPVCREASSSSGAPAFSVCSAGGRSSRECPLGRAIAVWGAETRCPLAWDGLASLGPHARALNPPPAEARRRPTGAETSPPGPGLGTEQFMRSPILHNCPPSKVVCVSWKELGRLRTSLLFV